MSEEVRNEELEKTVVGNLIANSAFFTKIIPYLEENHFMGTVPKKIVRYCTEYAKKYSKMPNFNELIILIESDMDTNNLLKREASDYLKDLQENNRIVDNIDFLCSQTESMAKDNAIITAITNSYDIWVDDKDNINQIKELVENALSLSFEEKGFVGLFDNLENFFDEITSEESKLLFDIEELNFATNNGVLRQTLNMLIAGTNVGKTLLLCYFAVMYAKLGYNVFFASSELGENDVRKRMFANIMDYTLGKFAPNSGLTKDDFIKKGSLLRTRLDGKIKMKTWEIHTASAFTLQRELKNEESKTGWKPDVILVDHLSLFKSAYASSNLRGTNDHKYEQFVAEEMRNLAKVTNTALWSASQFNRDGLNDGKGRLTNLAGSIGVAYTSDFILTMNYDLETNIMTCEQVKSRYSNKSSMTTFKLGVDYDRQKLYSLGEDVNNIVNRENTNVVSFEDRTNNNVVQTPTTQNEKYSEITF